MIILDTNIISHLHSVDTYGVQITTALAASPDKNVWITTVTAHEIVKGAVEYVAKRTKDRRDMVPSFRLVDNVIKQLAVWKGLILPYDAQAERIYLDLPAAIRKPMKADGWIAAIARRHDATIWTRNVRDFQKIPDLVVVDPTKDSQENPKAN